MTFGTRARRRSDLYDASTLRLPSLDRVVALRHRKRALRNLVHILLLTLSGGALEPLDRNRIQRLDNLAQEDNGNEPNHR